MSLLEGESDLIPARDTCPARFKPDRACVAACLAEPVQGTEEYGVVVVVVVVVLTLNRPFHPASSVHPVSVCPDSLP